MLILVLAALSWCLWLMSAEPKKKPLAYTREEAEIAGEMKIRDNAERFYYTDCPDQTAEARYWSKVLNVRLWRINADYRAGVITEYEAQARWDSEHKYHQTQLSAIAGIRRLGIGESTRYCAGLDESEAVS